MDLGNGFLNKIENCNYGTHFLRIDQMTQISPPQQPKNSFRFILQLTSSKPRLDQVLIEELRKQSKNLELKNISRASFKELFKNKRVRIKGQPAVPSSSLAQGITYVDILGFDDSDPASL